ncbi:MAG TPA: M15 family metallopeptidase [Jiangellaceae bacterium]
MSSSVRAGLLRSVAVGAAAAVLAGCGTGNPAAAPASVATTTARPGSVPSDAEPTNNPSPTRAPTMIAPAEPAVQQGRPAWLGSRVLPLRPDGLGEIQPTPPELVDRRLPPPEARPAPDAFQATVEPVPDDVVARSTWSSDCPVSLADLRYLTLTFWGFDNQPHLGELIVHSSVAGDVVEVFSRLYDARFPIEEMRVVAAPELNAPPTGDGNNTSAFVCRPSTGGAAWSQHAYGLAVDVNPFHNPYHRGDAVIPELASAYLDRTRDASGMIRSGDVVTTAFASIGWRWGGNWNSSKDWMHFSQSGR